MTIEEQLREFDLTGSQRYEILEAHDENPEGLQRVISKANGANNPTAALISLVRKGEHTKQRGGDKGTKPAHDTLDDIVEIALRMFNARLAKYPDWGKSSAIDYGAEFAPSWNRRFTFDEVRAGLCKRLAVDHDYTPTQPPAEMVERMKRMATSIGDMPEAKPAPPAAVDDLAARLLATLGKAA